ncbi:hypothetical protein [Nostoc sp. 'Peltigera membranacea cyanobiont' 232]|uniref:hypothetical protein n=1 Tax=Nostoc sp. 'Peltigera membranacea cyanobiont' 232 TaxID=2014531 RepID=UPI001CB95595|nr:hypothetical protein [Nostoc sp. 'Peltigera membranacea cyanobiont' 232]
MTKRRARLNDDNDPLSSTDKVLAGFEQISKSTSQQDEVSTSQEADKLTNQPDKLLTSQEADKPTSQQDEVSTSKEADKSTSQPDKLLTSRKSDKSASQQDEVSTSKEADKLTSQQSKSEHTFEASTSQQNNTPIIQLNSNSTSQKANLLTSQQVNLEKVLLRKSTFQISEEVLHQLDKLHLTLQLELGKANAPYKEVIVEEALVQLLESFNSDRATLIEILMSRQKSRDKL